jgi:cytochrome P450
MDAVSAAIQLMSPQGRRDPYPLYAVLRAHGPVLALEDQLLVTSYRHASAVLRDPQMLVVNRDMLRRRFGSEFATRPAQALLTDSMLNTNPPDHRRMRQLVSGAFTPRRVAALRTAIEAQAMRLADALHDSDEPVDLMEQFAVPLPVTVICELLGVPDSDRGWFRPVAVDFAEAVEYAITTEAADRADRAATQLRDYFIGLVADRRRKSADDLTSELAAAAASADAALSGAELLGNLALLLLAGHETTTNLIGNGMAVLFGNPDSLTRLRSSPELAPAFVEEFLRFDSPVQMTTRVPASPTTVAGVGVTRRVEVTVLIGAANRDPDRFSAPDSFDPFRRDNAPLSFGAGAHFCLGAALARLEAQIAFPLLLARFPGLRPAGDPIRRDRLVLRGFSRLPVGL